MTRRWLKLRKRFVGVTLPVLRAISPRGAARLLALAGRGEFALSSGAAARHHAAVQGWVDHFNTDWDVDTLSRGLAGNEVRWQARDLLLDGLSDPQFDSLFEVTGREHLDNALGEGRGVILLASHFGSHMVPLHWVLRKGYPMRVYMERPNHISRYLARRFAEGGPLGQDKLFISRKFSASESAASIMRATRILKAGMVLCLAGDVRWSGPNTAPAMFLGTEHSFTATWVVLATMTRSPIVPVFCRMRPDGTYDLEFRPVLRIPHEPAARSDVPRHVQGFLDTVERELRRDPTNGNEYATWPVAPARIPLAQAG